MIWYYAENGVRKGPLNDEEFQALVAAGTINRTMLVWHEGMADWQPYSVIAPANAVAPDAPPSIPAPGGPVVVCSECGLTVFASETLQIGGRAVCASCKPRVVQRLVEGADATSSGPIFDPDALLARLRARGGYKVASIDAADRAFELVKANFWPCVGVTALTYLVLGVIGQVPCVGPIAQLVLTAPLMGGLYIYFLRQLRGKPATLNEAFSGFRQPIFGQLALNGVVSSMVPGVIMLLGLAPGFILAISHSSYRHDPDVPMLFLAAGVPCGLIALVIALMWFPATVIIADKGIGFWAAMELSRKLVFMGFGGWLAFVIVAMGITLLGFLALCLGIFVAMPVVASMVVVVWDGILRRAEDTSASVSA